MKQYISFLILMVLLWAQSVHAESGDISSEIAGINADISSSLDSAPVPIEHPNEYTPWELIHRSAMLSGFQWSNDIAQFLTPRMYIGTPFAADNTSYGSQSSTLGQFLVEDATTYSECLVNESYLSYGLGERLEKTDILELKAIAKTCAQQFYGTYFDGKPYTTREEYIMMLMTMFGEDVSVDGEFTSDGKYIASGGPGIESGFDNVSPTAWYSPYLAFADEIGILSTDESKWQVARAITDAEAIDMLSLYTAYHMQYSGADLIQKGMIQTENLRYEFGFISKNEMSIKVITGGNIPVTIINNTTQSSTAVATTNKRYPGCDTDDIKLSNGQVWAACNVGATKAGTGVESYGSYFQWGRNTNNFTITADVFLNHFNWQSNTNWGGNTTTQSGWIYSELSSTDSTAMQWACSTWYHIPTNKEWGIAFTSIDPTIQFPSVISQINSSISSILKIPLAWLKSYYDAGYSFQGTNWDMWSSTPADSSSAYWVSLVNNQFGSAVTFTVIGKASWASIRCLKN
jgi:uncharacterized protein (TIGR02145 family)